MRNKPLSVVLPVWAVRPIPAELTHAGAGGVGWLWLKDRGWACFRVWGSAGCQLREGAVRLSSASRRAGASFQVAVTELPSASTFRVSAGLMLVIVALATPVPWVSLESVW